MQSDTRFNDTDHLIQVAFIELLNKKSFIKITINDICKQALIGRSTFYHHYVDKYELLDDTIDKIVNNFQQLLNQREHCLTDDDFLIYLYNDLFNDRDAFLTLLTVKESSSPLDTQIKKLLKNFSVPIVDSLNSSLPKDFLTDLYAVTALNAITWTLKNGYSHEIATFMNDSLKKIIN